MKKRNIGSAVLALVLILSLLTAPALAEETEITDFAGELRLNLYSETVKQEVTVKAFVDGDTTHFFVPETVVETGVLKARYLAVNTPESTGKIEEWGKKASQFTREKLENAVSIIVESDDGQWHLDSTSTRYLVWVWYQPDAASPYRCLNVELLQNGLAIANSSGQNRYGDICLAAIAQARAQKLNIYSGEKDPDFFYGDAIELTIKELRLHPEAYEGKKVAFTGVITMNHNNSVFIEDYDEETGLYFGISAYYGFNLSGGGLDVLAVGNESRIVGTMQYYEAGDTWQVSGLTYRMMKPKDPGNIQKISDGHAPAWTETAPDMFNGMVTIETDDGAVAYPYAFLALDTSVFMDHLTVTDVYVNDDPESSSHGALTLTCRWKDQTVIVHSIPLADENGAVLEAPDLLGRSIAVHGIAGQFNGQYQLQVYLQDGIAFLE